LNWQADMKVGVQALPPKQGADATGLLFGLIGLSQNPLFVLGP